MGALASRQKASMETPPARPNHLKRIEDPRSPTEEISRTPIEVADKLLKETDGNNLHRATLLKEQNQFAQMDYSPRLRKTELTSKDFKKLKSQLVSTFENESMISNDLDSTSLVEKEVNEKENNYY